MYVVRVTEGEQDLHLVGLLPRSQRLRSAVEFALDLAHNILGDHALQRRHVAEVVAVDPEAAALVM